MRPSPLSQDIVGSMFQVRVLFADNIKLQDVNRAITLVTLVLPLATKRTQSTYSTGAMIFTYF